MREIEFCMKYDVCARCPLDAYCEYFYKQERGEDDAEDLQDVWSGNRKPLLSSQEELSKDKGQTE